MFCCRMIAHGKKVNSLQTQGESLLQEEKFKCLRVLFPSDNNMEWKMAFVRNTEGINLVFSTKEGTELKDKTHFLLVHLCSNSHLC